jgi:6-phosphofructokinase 1
MIRTVPAMPSDQIMCGHLASSAVHGAMAGFTGFTCGHVQSSVAMIPLS